MFSEVRGLEQTNPTVATTRATRRQVPFCVRLEDGKDAGDSADDQTDEDHDDRRPCADVEASANRLEGYEEEPETCEEPNERDDR